MSAETELLDRVRASLAELGCLLVAMYDQVQDGHRAAVDLSEYVMEEFEELQHSLGGVLPDLEGLEDE